MFNLKVLGSDEGKKGDPSKQINYLVAPTKVFVLCRFLVECGHKLNAKVMTIATAQTLFHKFTRAAKTSTEYDPYVRPNCARIPLLQLVFLYS